MDVTPHLAIVKANLESLERDCQQQFAWSKRWRWNFRDDALRHRWCNFLPAVTVIFHVHTTWGFSGQIIEGSGFPSPAVADFSMSHINVRGPGSVIQAASG